MAVKPLILIFDSLFGIVTFLQMIFHFDTFQSWVLFIVCFFYWVGRFYYSVKKWEHNRQMNRVDLELKKMELAEAKKN